MVYIPASMTRFILVLGGLCALVAIGFQSAALAQTITNQPRSITVNNASSAEFTVGATNATTYQWRFNGTNLSDGPNISGSTNAALTLENLSSNQAGNYSVVLNGSVTSSNAVLTIVPGTIIRFTLSNLLPSAPSNTLDIQLFDHDKPATVENFLHYVTKGGYTNMFFDRCVPNFVLQGGDNGASNQTSSTPPITGWSINSQFTMSTNQSPSYPQQVENEFGMGPLIHNRFGTISMALGQNTNSATCAFFFNLVDNSSYLDGQNFTVFGRILNATNVLQYFNSVVNGNGGVLSGQILLPGQTNTQPIPDLGDGSLLPVNYTGTNEPANNNLVFCSFSFPFGAPPTDTNPPTVAITSSNILQTNSNPVIQGTASDNVALADIFSILTPVAAADGTLPNSGATVTNHAIGTTDWTITLGQVEQGFFGEFTNPIPPGVYDLTVEAQDGAGNLSAPVTETMTNTAIVIVGNGTVAFTQGASATNNPVGYPFQTGTNYTLVATPGAGQAFVEWTSASITTTNATLSLSPYEGGVYTATFISNTAGGIAFTAPVADSTLSNTLFNISGAVSTSVLTLPVTVTAQIFTNAVSNYAVTLPQSTVTDGTDWSIGVTNYLPTGSYTILALATDKNGLNTLISEDFHFVADTNPPTVTITSPTNNAFYYLGSPIVVSGKAGDSIVPVTSVGVTLVPQTNADGTVPHVYISFPTNATGTTNWTIDLATLNLPPGNYEVEVQAHDAPGNLSPPATQYLTISGVQIVGNGTVTVTRGTNVITNLMGYPLQPGTTYVFSETPAAGYAFYNWNYGGVISTARIFTNNYNDSLLTATFVPSNTLKIPHPIAFVYPAPNAELSVSNFTIKGRISPKVGGATVTCQISALDTGLQIGPLLTATGTTSWTMAVSNLPPDAYLLQATATNASGFGASISELFAVVRFKQVAGTYYGLFICDNEPVSPTNSGLITVTVANSGAYSAMLYFPAFGPILTDYQFGANGTMYSPYEIFPNYPLSITMFLDLTNGTDTITGSIEARSGPWTSPLFCHRGVTKLSSETIPALGKYIMDLEPTNMPNNFGYASISATAGGTMAVSGALPDGAAFSQSVRPSTNGIWPLFAVPAGYRTNGMIMGWVTNQPDGYSSGQLYWYKGRGLGKYFTNGITTFVNPIGTNYVAPGANTYSIIFQGSTMADPITNMLSVARAGQAFKPMTASDRLGISISPFGVLSGHFYTGNKTVQFKGGYFGAEAGGDGFVLDGGSEPGYFLLEPQ